MAEEIHGDDAIPRRKLVHHAAPAVGTSAEAVYQQKHLACALVEVRDPVAVQREHAEVRRVGWGRFPDCLHGLLLT